MSVRGPVVLPQAQCSLFSTYKECLSTYKEPPNQVLEEAQVNLVDECCETGSAAVFMHNLCQTEAITSFDEDEFLELYHQEVEDVDDSVELPPLQWPHDPADYVLPKRQYFHDPWATDIDDELPPLQWAHDPSDYVLPKVQYPHDPWKETRPMSACSSMDGLMAEMSQLRDILSSSTSSTDSRIRAMGRVTELKSHVSAVHLVDTFISLFFNQLELVDECSEAGEDLAVEAACYLYQLCEGLEDLSVLLPFVPRALEASYTPLCSENISISQTASCIVEAIGDSLPDDEDMTVMNCLLNGADHSDIRVRDLAIDLARERLQRIHKSGSKWLPKHANVKLLNYEEDQRSENCCVIQFGHKDVEIVPIGDGLDACWFAVRAKVAQDRCTESEHLQGSRYGIPLEDNSIINHQDCLIVFEHRAC